ncbi:uncharacterized protein LOC122849477 [Aphidius gifuensis]|uniref:uncharacterized protein LOC122849477 n=1 Tax=Aphidius gifuensis TaxID=684658 RepID=UPI001CDB984C|nr:uncharacterized protein LOC122849477 [Aphidius gifuensis]
MSHIYLKELQKSRSTYVLTENYKVKNHMKETRLNIFILLRNHNDLDNLTVNINEVCGLGCKFTVLLIDNFGNEELFIEESNILIQLLWIKKIANVVIIGFVNDHYLAMESKKFKPNILREPMDPVIVGKCHNKKWIMNGTLFEPMKMNNCSVNIGYLINEPYMHAVEKNNSFEYNGVDLAILQVIANHLNFTINLSEMEGSKNVMKTQKIANSLHSNRSYDLIIGGMVWQPKDDIDYTIAYEVVQIVWLVPVQPEVTSFMALISPLEMTVWFAIIVVFLFAIIIRFTLFYKISFLEIFAIILGVGWNRQPIGFYYRTMFISWIIFGFILTQFYLASLPGRLLEDPEEEIDTINDLLDSGIPLGGSKLAKLFFVGNRTINSSSTSSGLIDKIFKKFIVFERIDYEKKVQDLISGKNSTIALLVITNSSTVNPNFDSRVLHILPEALTTFPLGFPVWRNLPYLNDIDIIIQRLLKSGIISHFFNLATKKHSFEDVEDNIYIDLQDLIPGFLILGVGCTIGLITLIFEIIIFRIKQRDIT